VRAMRSSEVTTVAFSEGGIDHSWREGVVEEDDMPSTYESLTQELKDSGAIDQMVSDLPWAIIQKGIDEGGIFEIISSRQCEKMGIKWFFGATSKADFENNKAIVVDYFETQAQAEQFLNVLDGGGLACRLQSDER